VLALTSCVTEALDELSNCLVAGHGGTFSEDTVTLDTTADLQLTLTCNGTSASFRQSNLAGCHDSKVAPSPVLADQTLDGRYQVFPMQQSNRRIFNCRFLANSP
jgi:hypothetical protein